MSAKIIDLPTARRRHSFECPGDHGPPQPDRREAVFRCLVSLAEAETYHDADRFLEMLWAQGFMVARRPDEPAA